MSTQWIIEISEDFPDGARVADAVRAKGGDAETVDASSPTFVWPSIVGIPIGCGSVNFILKMLRQRFVNEGVLDFTEGLRCSTYYHYVYDMLCRRAMFLPFGALPHADVRFFGDEVFIRPDAAIKQFDGQVIRTADLKRPGGILGIARGIGGLVVLSEVVEMGDEYRVFCRNGEAMCWSMYKPTVSPIVPKEVILMAEKAAKRLIESTGSVISVDVAKNAEGQLRLVEVNGVNAAGLYACDLEAFISMMEAEARERRSMH